MILYINTRLLAWSEWVIKGRRVSGLSYPTQVSYARLATSGGGRHGAEFDEEAWEIEQAVNALRAELKQLVHDFYLRTTTGDMLARKLGCSRDTIYHRLHLAHVEIMGSLNDMAVGCFKTVDTSDKVVHDSANCDSVRPQQPAVM